MTVPEPLTAVCWACLELASGPATRPVLHPACRATLAGWRHDYAAIVAEHTAALLAARARPEGLVEVDPVLRVEWASEFERLTWTACY